MNTKYTLASIKINKFKSESQSVKFDFNVNNEKITIIHGDNGVGKTTLINLIASILRRDQKLFEDENVNDIELMYTQENEKGKSSHIEKLFYNQENKKLTVNSLNGKTSLEKLCDDSKSIFIGSSRGTHSAFDFVKSELVKEFFIENEQVNLNVFSRNDEFEKFSSYINENNRNRIKDDFEDFNKRNHLYLDTINVKFIEQTIVSVFKSINEDYEKEIISTLLTKFSNLKNEEGIVSFKLALDDSKLNNFNRFIEVHEKSFSNQLFSTFDMETLKTSELAINKIVESESKSSPQNLIQIVALEAFLKNSNKYNKIVRLVDKFNKYLKSKSLVMTDNLPTIRFNDIPDQHTINKLSNGELSLLAIFLIVELFCNTHLDFLIIDEISTSFDTDWLEMLLSDIKSGNNINQVIVTSHSPDIAMNHHRDCQKRLEIQYS